MKHETILRLAGIACATCLATTTTAAQEPSFVGTWRNQTTMIGAGGLPFVIDAEDVFQPNGNFSAFTSSRYPNGNQIGAVHATGTYKVDAVQHIIEFHTTERVVTQPVTSPDTESDRYQFTSPTTFTLQPLQGGGPIMTFQRVQ
jgi:hypothetical protein